MLSSKLNFAVVGCGRIGLRRMQSIAENPAARLLCVADVNPDDSSLAAEQFKVPQFADYRSVAELDVNSVIVAVPNRFHHETVTYLLNNKKHVFCEKPLAGVPEESRHMVATAIENGVTLKTGSNLRYFPSIMKAKQFLHEDKIGKILFVRGWIGHDGWNLKQTWYSDLATIGGGTLLDNGSHLLDVIRWFFGEIIECTGIVSSKKWKLPGLEDNAMSLLKTEDGIPVFVQASWTEWR